MPSRIWGNGIAGVHFFPRRVSVTKNHVAMNESV